MIKQLNRQTTGDFKVRIGQLRPDSERRFGTMDTTRMMRHMRMSLEASLGEADIPDNSFPVVRSLIFWTITRLITTWPGGRLKAPDFWSPPAEGSFEEERALLLGRLDAFVEALERGDSAKHHHPMMGPLTHSQWSRLLALHFHHHFRQFGAD